MCCLFHNMLRDELKCFGRRWAGFREFHFIVTLIESTCSYRSDQEWSIEAAEEKRLEFPRGSSFQWVVFGQAGEEKGLEEISQFATEHGLKVESMQVKNSN
jgi:hypothetical protein